MCVRGAAIGIDLLGRVGRDADLGSGAEQRARLGGRHGVPAEVHAIGADGQRDVDAPVHEHARDARAPRGAAPRGFEHVLRERAQRLAAEVALAHLHPVHAGRDDCLDELRRRPAQQRAIEHQRQDRAPGAQKLASPSSGLDAEA
jgi:hypothetical protein